MTWTAPDVARVDEPVNGDERAMSEGLLERQRATLLHKCAGLTGEQLALRSTPRSNLSLLGLIRHLTNVERDWFRRRFAGEQIDPVYYREGTRDIDFDEIDPAHAEREHAALIAECDACRRAVSGLPLDHTYAHPRFGDVAALGNSAHDRGICPAQRAGGHYPRTNRRRHREVGVC